MQTLEPPGLADPVHPHGADDAALRLAHRLVDERASDEAAAALERAAGQAPHEGPAGDALASAHDLLAASHRRPGADAARDRLSAVASGPDFRGLLRGWSGELREAAASLPDTGACTVATALELWSWTSRHLLSPAAPEAASIAGGELAEALASLLAARSLALEVAATGPGTGESLRVDVSHAYAARVSAAAGALCAELVFGYRRHLGWNADGCTSCYAAGDLDELEALMPGIASGAGSDVIEADGTHPAKEGPCVRFDGVDAFVRLRNRLDGCLTGARISKDRAAAAIAGRTATTTERKA
jgi:hypothetical protein